MSNEERFRLYKYYERLLSRVLLYCSKTKYPENSIERKYSSLINKEIDDFVYVEDKEFLEMYFKQLLNKIKCLFSQYHIEIFDKNGIDYTFSYKFDYDCDFDSFVKQVSDAIKIFEEKKNCDKSICESVDQIINENPVNPRIINYAERIKDEARQIQFSYDYEESMRNIDEMINFLKGMVDKYSLYLARINKFELLFGDYHPMAKFLEQYKSLVYEGRFSAADELVWKVNLQIKKFRAAKFVVDRTTKIIEENYNSRINSLSDEDDKEKIAIADAVYQKLMDLLGDILSNKESRDLLPKLHNISFENMREFYEIITFKTCGLCIEAISDRSLKESDILLVINSDDRSYYCYGIHNGVEENFKVSKSYFRVKYIRLLDVFENSDKIGTTFLTILQKRLGIVDIESLKEESPVVAINMIVDFMESKKAAFDKTMNPAEITLKRVQKNQKETK